MGNSDMSAPQYLAEPVLNGHSYGTVRYLAKSGHYEVEADPSVLMFAKRVFPGCAIQRTRETVLFKATKRTFGDLNWLLLRYPMEVKCPEQFVELMGDATPGEGSKELAQSDARKHLQGVIQKLARVGA